MMAKNGEKFADSPLCFILCLHDSIFNVSLGKLLTNWNVGVAMMVLLGEAKCTAFIVIA